MKRKTIDRIASRLGPKVAHESGTQTTLLAQKYFVGPAVSEGVRTHNAALRDKFNLAAATNRIMQHAKANLSAAALAASELESLRAIAASELITANQMQYVSTCFEKRFGHRIAASAINRFDRHKLVSLVVSSFMADVIDRRLEGGGTNSTGCEAS